jgi:hypothetical protein
MRGASSMRAAPTAKRPTGIPTHRRYIPPDASAASGAGMPKKRVNMPVAHHVTAAENASAQSAPVANAARAPSPRSASSTGTRTNGASTSMDHGGAATA